MSIIRDPNKELFDDLPPKEWVEVFGDPRGPRVCRPYRCRSYCAVIGSLFEEQETLRRAGRLR